MLYLLQPHSTLRSSFFSQSFCFWGNNTKSPNISVCFQGCMWKPSLLCLVSGMFIWYKNKFFIIGCCLFHVSSFLCQTAVSITTTSVLSLTFSDDKTTHRIATILTTTFECCMQFLSNLATLYVHGPNSELPDVHTNVCADFSHNWFLGALYLSFYSLIFSVM